MKHAVWTGARLALSVTMMMAWGGPALAQSDLNARERIARERVTVESAYLAAERECQDRFAVTACVENARRKRRSDLAELRRQATVLDEAQRKQRAERRRQAIRDNQARDEAQSRGVEAKSPREPVVVPPQRRTPVAPESVKVPRPSPAKAAPLRSPATSASPAAAQTEAARNKANYEARQREAQAHRDKVKRRNEEGAQRRKPADSLPVPPASSP